MFEGQDGLKRGVDMCFRIWRFLSFFCSNVGRGANSCEKVYESDVQLAMSNYVELIILCSQCFQMIITIEGGQCQPACKIKMNPDLVACGNWKSFV